MSANEVDAGDKYGVPVHQIEKNRTEQIRISLNEYKGHQYIDIRVFFRSGNEFLPSKKGVTLSEEQYPELLQGILLLGDALGFDAENIIQDNSK